MMLRVRVDRIDHNGEITALQTLWLYGGDPKPSDRAATTQDQALTANRVMSWDVYTTDPATQRNPVPVCTIAGHRLTDSYHHLLARVYAHASIRQILDLA